MGGISKPDNKRYLYKGYVSKSANGQILVISLLLLPLPQMIMESRDALLKKNSYMNKLKRI